MLRQDGGSRRTIAFGMGLRGSARERNREMALLTKLRAIWIRHRLSRKTDERPQLALDDLEARDAPAVGGGFTAGGILGEYYDNATLSGAPAFSRQDVRIDFNWGFEAPGGSNSPDFKKVGADNFSVRWTGQLIPRFSETYTFRTTSDDGVRLWIKPTGTSTWIPLVSDWSPHASTDDTGSIALTAGQTYDVRMEYYESTGAAVARLLWSSPSTPEEVIDPATDVGVNAVTYDSVLYTDAAKSGRAEWGDPTDYFNKPLVALDANGYPTTDAGHIFWEGQDPTTTNGVYQLRFAGRAQVTSWFGEGEFRVNGTDLGTTLPFGAGYDPATNTTVADVVVNNSALFGLNFVQTQRTPTSATDTGITNVQLIRPLAPGSGSYYRPTDIFDSNVKDALSRFTTLRYLSVNFDTEQNWSDRKLPGEMKVAWGDRDPVWEYEVMLANETGKDLYITIPIDATADYVQKLALLLRYGSDGVNPYTAFQTNPVYPGLNPNLHVYVEWANETWNWSFTQSSMGGNAAKAAVHSGTAEGKIIDFDGQRPDGDFRRWTALKTVEASNTFRSVWGDAAMGDSVRVVLEYQYDNQQDTALEALRFIDNYFDNGDGRTHVSDPHPVSYYIWGAGGASYFGASNPEGITSDIPVPDGDFEFAHVANGKAVADPIGTPWTFTGDAGVYRNASGFGANQRIAVDGIGAVPTTPSGNQALYVSGSGTTTVTINFPRAGVYALDFQAAAEFGNNMADPLDFYFDDTRVTPNGADLTPNPNAWVPGTGFGRDPSQFVVYGTVPVVVTGPGQHTFKVVGRGTVNQTTLIDNVRVASTDAIFASKIPSGGQAAGQISTLDYQGQLIAEAKYALAYGLNYVAYEGGWSLGGDTQSVPIESYAKYRDPRATSAMEQALDDFFRAGGELDVLGTYDQWYLEDSANASSYPLVTAIDSRVDSLPVAPTAGVAVPGTLPVSARATDATDGTNSAGFVRPGEWLSWNVLVPTTGDYQVSALTSSGGRVAIIVDGDPITDGSTGSSRGDIARLTAGIHAVRVQAEAGTFYIRSITVLHVGGPAQASPTVVTPANVGLPAGWASDNIGSPAVFGGARDDNGSWTVTGAGANIWGASDEFEFAHTNVNGDAVMTARIDSIDATNSWAKAGIMMRDGTGASAPFAAVYNTPGNGVMFEWRSYYRSAPVSVSVAVPSGPLWVQLVRRGNSFAAYYSQDGKTWTRIGVAQTVLMPGGIQAGLVVTSHDVNRKATVKFSNVTLA
jgi:hypothetical protein